MEVNRRELSKKFEYLGGFIEGKALAKQNGKFFHVNEKGEPLYKQRYDCGCEFSEGFAAVCLDNKSFFIDEKGQIAFGKKFVDVSSFKDGLAWICEDGDKWAQIDRRGRLGSRWFEGYEIW